MFDNRVIIIHILSFYSSYAFITFKDFLKKFVPFCIFSYEILKKKFAFSKKNYTIEIYPLVVELNSFFTLIGKINSLSLFFSNNFFYHRLNSRITLAQKKIRPPREIPAAATATS